MILLSVIILQAKVEHMNTTFLQDGSVGSIIVMVGRDSKLAILE